MTSTRYVLLAGWALAATLVTPNDARACGGCFMPPAESTVVTGHRMAMAVSNTQTVLWDQIQYSGDPEDFSWVLPVKKGAYLEVAANAWFEVLETGSRVTVYSRTCAPPPGDPGCGCGDD